MLGAPLIQGKLSECSRGVQFHQLVVGATVRLQTQSGVQIGHWTVTNADEAFDFTAGTVLKAGTTVQAMQLTASESGQLSPLTPVGGHPKPTDLNAGAFAKPLFECGECVWLFGLFAGADVVVLSHGSETLGKGVVRPDGSVEVELNRPLKIGDDLSAVQTACVSIGGQVKSKVPIAGGRPIPLDGLTLPQTLVHPAKRCATALYIEKIMDGASITLTRTPKGGSASKFSPRCIPTAPFTLWGFAPFQSNEALVIETNLQKCKKPVGTKVVQAVDPNPPGAPVILNAICTDTPDLVLSGLELNALIEIVIHHPGTPTTLHFGASAPQDNFSLAVGTPPVLVQSAGAQITVRQNLCGGPGDWSTITSTTVQAAAPVPPHPFTPINLATSVSLTTYLQWTDAGNAPCSQASTYDVRVSKTKTMGPADLVFAPKLPIASNIVGVPGGVLIAGTTYFWQVRAYHPGNPIPSSWSVLFQFTTVNRATQPPNGGGGGDQTFYFCQTCPGFDQGKTITVIAPDYATAEAKASKNLPLGCFLSSGKCV